MFDASDPGTGKTIANLAVFDTNWKMNRARRLLVICPKSIMTLAWGRDIERAFPHLTYAVADASRRVEAFMAGTTVVIMNHDGVIWLKNNPELFGEFTDLIIDESTAYKNRTAQRSKACALIAASQHWLWKSLLSGTPTPNSIVDIWHQVKLLDGGLRLGKNYYAFQSACCEAEQVGPSANHLKWTDKEGIHEVVYTLLEDIVIRHKLEDCISIPENQVIEYRTTLNQKQQRQYEYLRRHAILELENGTIDAFHAGTLRQKLLQLASGAVYTDEEYELVDTDRYNLVLDLIEERTASLVAFIWKHQRDMIAALAQQRGLAFAVIDSDTSDGDRIRHVDAFQRGELRFILGHPKTMAHGITLTYGTATIWPSPTDNAEQFVQMNRRVYRNGQTARTETILIMADNTLEPGVFANLQGKVERQQNLLELIQGGLTPT